MKRVMYRQLPLIAMIVAFCTAAAVWANVPEPKRRPEKPRISQEVPFVIRGDRSTTKNKLIIPKKFLQGADKVSAVDERGDRTRTVIAGILLSLGAVGLVFVGLKRKRLATKSGIGAAVALIGSLITIQMATADVAPPIREIPRTWRHVAKSQQSVQIIIVEKGEAVELVLGTYYRSPSRDRFREEKERVPPPTSSASPPRKTGAAKPN